MTPERNRNGVGLFPAVLACLLLALPLAAQDISGGGGGGGGGSSGFIYDLLGGRVFPEGAVIESYAAHAPSNAFFKHDVFTISDTGSTDLCVWGSFHLPQSCGTSVTITLGWSGATGSATGQLVHWEFGYAAIAAGESADASAFTETVDLSDAGPATAEYIMEISATATAGNFAADDRVQWGVCRALSESDDDYADDAQLHSAIFDCQ